MTPDEIAAIFAAATDDFAVVVGQPSDEDINAIERALLPLLHDVDYDMYGAQNLIGLIEPTITYTLTWGQAFVRPPRPTAYDLNIADTASPVVRNRMEAAHTLLLNDYYSFVAAEKGAAKFIRTCVDETYYKDLQHATTFYNKVTAEELLVHLRSNCGGVEPENLIALQTAMASYYTLCEGIPEYIIMLEKARTTLVRAGLPMSDKQLLTIASASVYASQDFPRASEDWERLTTLGKTWTAWKTMFLRAHRDRARLVQAQGGANIGGLANMVGNYNELPPTAGARIDSYLDNLANAATQDTQQLALLVESNRTLTAQVAALAARLATGLTPPEVPPIIAPTTRTPAQLLAHRITEKKLDPAGYCWSHGYMVHKTHTSATCKKKKEGHVDTATRADIKGGRTFNVGWEVGWQNI